jgi:hypothetical protein
MRHGAKARPTPSDSAQSRDIPCIRARHPSVRKRRTFSSMRLRVRGCGPLLVLAFLLLFFPSCRAELSVGLNIDAEGSTDVALILRLDQEAVGALAATLGPDWLEHLDWSDLTETGWSVRYLEEAVSSAGARRKPESLQDKHSDAVSTAGRTDAGSFLMISRRFPRAEEVSPALSAITFGGRPLVESFVLDLERRFFETRYSLLLETSLPPAEELLGSFSKGFKTKGSEGLSEATSPQSEAAGQVSGFRPGELVTQLAPPDLQMTVQVRLPGRVVAAEPTGTGEVSGSSVTYSVRPGEKLTIRVVSQRRQAAPAAWFAASAGLSLLATGSYMVARRRSTSRSLRT